MPKVNPGESEREYVTRCIPFVMKEDNCTTEQAAGKCGGMYKSHKEAARKRADKD